MDELKKEEVFSTLNRINQVIHDSPLIQGLSNFMEITTSVVGGAVRDLYLDKPIKDIDIAISLDFMANLKVNYPTRYRSEGKYYLSRELDDDSDYWDKATAEADALKTRNFQIIEKLKTPEYFILHEFIEKNKKDLSAIDAIVFLIRKIIEQHEDYAITQVFDKTTLEILSDMPKLDDIPYQNMGLCAVLGIKDKHTDYPIELLFTPDNPIGFIKCFDFNICKTYMENIGDEAVIHTSNEFLQDCTNKTITYTPPPESDEKKVSKSLLVRYERFQQKFPDFILKSDIKNVSDELKKFIETTISAVNLKYELSANDAIAPVRAVKKVNKL
jgi:hypothetical protein